MDPRMWPIWNSQTIPAQDITGQQQNFLFLPL